MLIRVGGVWPVYTVYRLTDAGALPSTRLWSNRPICLCTMFVLSVCVCVCARAFVVAIYAITISSQNTVNGGISPSPHVIPLLSIMATMWYRTKSFNRKWINMRVSQPRRMCAYMWLASLAWQQTTPTCLASLHRSIGEWLVCVHCSP